MTGLKPRQHNPAPLARCLAGNASPAPRRAVDTPLARRLRDWCLLLVLPWLAAVCAAQADPQARMGRLSLVVGSVEATLEEGSNWTPATLNLPLGPMSRVRTGAQSRAEVRIGSVTIHIDANSALVLRTVDDNRLVIGLLRGDLALHVPSAADSGRVSVFGTTSSFDRAVAFQVMAPGRYQFNRPGNNPLKVQVLEGQGQWTGLVPSAAPSGPSPAVGTAAATVAAGRQAAVDLAERSLGEAGDAQPTPFTEWARQRSQRVPDTQTLRHVSAEMTGAEELDKHGSWATDPRWGALWVPAGVAADWAPYRQGRWVHTTRRGWAWVDETPWGFAPFHYGRWMFHSGRWAWSPGARVERPIYAPALVGFYGGGPEPAAWVGWFPLGPGEAYRPGFTASAGFVQNLNAPAFERLVSSGYRYANTLFAATAMNSEAFAAGQPVATAAVALNPAQLNAAGVREQHAPAVAARSAKAPASP